MAMNKIPNEMSARFTSAQGRRELIEKFGDSEAMFTGTNADGEMVTVSIHKEKGIVLNTYQENGHVRVNYYGKDGQPEGESFDGKWK